MIETVFITLLIVAICIILLGIRIFFVRNGKFPNTHVSGNKKMREEGVDCIQSQDRKAQKENKLAIPEIQKKDNNTN